MNWPTSASRLASVSLLAAATLGFTTACEKANDLGLDLPGTSPISAQYLDLPVTVSTVQQPAVPTVKADRFFVGRVQDSYVGTTSASAFVNLLVIPTIAPIDSLPAKFTAVTLDSVIFSLTFDLVYGSAAQPLRFNLLQLQQPLDDRTVYDSKSQVATGASLLTDFAAPLNRERTVRVPVSTAGGVNDTIPSTVPDQVIRIPLLKQPGTAALATAVFAAMQSASFNQDALDAVWKGVAMEPATGHTANIVGFPRTGVSRVTFYFTGTSAADKVRHHNYSLFLANITPQAIGQNAVVTDGKFFTQLTTDLKGTALASLSPQNPLPASATDGLTYVQEGVGLATRLDLKSLDLDNLRNNNDLAINRAELLIPVKQFSNGLFPYPTGLYLYEVNDANEALIRTSGAQTAERLVQREGIIETSSGSFRATPVTVGAPAQAVFPLGQNPPQYYAVSVTEYLQAYLQNRLEGELPTGLLLSPILRSATSLTLNRAQLDANNIKLRVYYSKLR